MDKSIHPNPRSEKTKIRRKVNHAKNKVARAQLYQEHRSNQWNQNISTWHTGIEALKLGTA